MSGWISDAAAPAPPPGLARYGVIRPRLVVYGLVGVLNSVAGFGTMALLALAGLPWLAYTAVGYLAGFASSYTLNGLVTFGGGPLSWRGLGRFVLCNGPLLLLVEAAQAALIEAAGLREAVAVVLGAVLYFLAGFALNRRLVFRPAA